MAVNHLKQSQKATGLQPEAFFYFLRFFSRVRSSFIDIVGSFLLSSINFQKVEEV
jgi:hypothetical protein